MTYISLPNQYDYYTELDQMYKFNSSKKVEPRSQFCDFLFQVNGENTLNENIADNGGVKESYRAMRQLIKHLNLKMDDLTKFSTDQLFFLGFGTVSILYVANIIR